MQGLDSAGRGLSIKDDIACLSVLGMALVAAMTLAGSSAAPPLRLWLVLGLIALAWTVCAARSPRGLALSREGLVLGLAILTVPALQLLPMPVALTGGLPGQAVNADVAAMAGGMRWRPLTVDIESTWTGLCQLTGFVGLFWATMLLSRRDYLRLLRGVLAVALAGLFLGSLQALSASPRLYLLADAIPGTLTGFFGNRNHQGDLLVIASGLCVVLGMNRAPARRERRVQGYLIHFGLALVFASGAIATQSRAAILLLILLGAALGLLHARRLLPGLGVIAAGGAILAGLVLLTPVGHVAFQRFLGDGGAYDRPLIWRESLVALRQVFPTGSGLGTFAHLYQSIEPLESVSSVYVNHAHSEVLQVPIELGLPGVLALLVAAGCLMMCAVRLVRAGDRFGCGLVACAAVPMLHSLVDYPLRNFGLSAVVAVVLAGAFAALPRASVASRRRVAGVVAGAFALLLALQGALAAMLLAQERPALAAAIMPLSSAARLKQAEQVLRVRGDPGQVRRLAQDALWLNSHSTRAWALMGYSYATGGDVPAADMAFLQAARLGWRDDLVQFYVFQRGIETGAARTAADAADALLRRDYAASGDVLGEMAGLLADARFREALAARLRERPRWTPDFIAALTPANDAKAAAQATFFKLLHERGVSLSAPDAAAYLARAAASGRGAAPIAAWVAANRGLGDPRRQSLASTAPFPFGWLPARQGKSQYLVLAPGRYTLSYPYGSAEPTMRCLRGRRNLASGPVVRGGGEARRAIAIPAARCEAQIVTVSDAGGTVAAVRIAPAGTAR